MRVCIAAVTLFYIHNFLRFVVVFGAFFWYNTHQSGCLVSSSSFYILCYTIFICHHFNSGKFLNCHVFNRKLNSFSIDDIFIHFNSEHVPFICQSVFLHESEKNYNIFWANFFFFTLFRLHDYLSKNHTFFFYSILADTLSLRF